MSCISQIGSSILPDCSGKIAGFEGRAIIWSAEWSGHVMITKDATNPAIITSMESANPGKKYQGFYQTPFDGSNVAMTTEDGYTKYTKQLMLRIPRLGASDSHSQVEPLPKGRFYIEVLMNDGRVIILGVYGVCRAVEITQNENENGGDWMVTLQSTEEFPLVELVPGTGTALETFENMWSQFS